MKLAEISYQANYTVTASMKMIQHFLMAEGTMIEQRTNNKSKECRDIGNKFIIISSYGAHKIDYSSILESINPNHTLGYLKKCE